MHMHSCSQYMAEWSKRIELCLKKYLSEVGFEPTPTDVDCDLNAAP